MCILWDEVKQLDKNLGNRIPTRSQEGLSGLEGHRLEIIHPGFGTSNNHGKLPADLVNRQRVVRSDLGCIGNNVEVWHAWFDHDDIGTLVNVPSLRRKSRHHESKYDRVDSQWLDEQALSRRVEAGNTSCRRRQGHSQRPRWNNSSDHQYRSWQKGDSPEWSIQAACKLGGIAHECALIAIARVNKFPLDGRDPPVHHVARGNTIRSGFGVGKSDVSETFDRRKGVDRSVFIEDAAVPVRGVLAKADITGDIQGWIQSLELFYGEDYGTLRVIREESGWVLRSGNGNMRAGFNLGCGPERTLTQSIGTPNRITLFSPFRTKGPIKSSSLFTPHLR